MYYSTVCGLLLAVWLGLAPPVAAQEVELPHLRELTGYLSYGTVSESLEHAVEERMTLTPGYSTSLEQVVLVHLEVSPTGQVENARIVPVEKGTDAVVAAAALAAVRQLPVLVPGRQDGQPVRSALTLLIRPGVAAAAANTAYEAQQAARNDTIEARTLRAGTIQRRPGETVAAFLGRVLPVAFAAADEPISYAWHPSVYGPQLFFSAPGHGPWPAELARYLFIFDPISPTQYAVQSFSISQADYTTLEALFFADTNHDGQKDLLALTQCDLREYVKVDGVIMPGRFAHYQTNVIYYRGLDSAGRPRYEQQYREDLDELATAAEVRRVLAVPPRRPAASSRPAKPAKR